MMVDNLFTNQSVDGTSASVEVVGSAIVLYTSPLSAVVITEVAPIGGTVFSVVNYQSTAQPFVVECGGGLQIRQRLIGQQAEFENVSTVVVSNDAE